MSLFWCDRKDRTFALIDRITSVARCGARRPSGSPLERTLSACAYARSRWMPCDSRNAAPLLGRGALGHARRLCRTRGVIGSFEWQLLLLLWRPMLLSRWCWARSAGWLSQDPRAKRDRQSGIARVIHR